MKKHILIAIFALALCLGFAVPAFADNPPGVETIPSITVNITDVPGLTATMTNAHDHYIESGEGYNLTFSFGDDGGTIGFNRDVVIFGFESFHMDGSEYAKINLKAGDTVEFGGAWDGFFLYTDGTKNITEKPDWTEENYTVRGVAFDSIPMMLGVTDETLANEGFNKRSIYDISASAAESPAAPATPAAPAANTVSAKPTASRVVVDGQNLSFDAYNINGNNYFKLRDLAYALSGSQKQFDVGWDGAANAITLTSGKAYTSVGGEMASSGAGDKTATPTSSKITLNGSEVSLTAYNIGGNNYFKLRDIGQEFNFGVDWDGARNTIVIDTSKGYTPEGASADGNSFDEIAAQGPQTFVYDRPAYGIKFDAPDYYGDVVCGESFYLDSEPVVDFDGEPAAFERDSEEYAFSVFVTDAPSLTMNTYFYKSGEMHIQTAKGTAVGNTVKLELTRLPDARHSADASASYQIPRGLSGIFAKFDADDEGWGGLYGGCIVMSKAEAVAFIESGALPAYLDGLTITGLDEILSGK